MPENKGNATLTRRSAMAAGVGTVLTAPMLARAAEPVSVGLTPVFLDSDLVLLRDMERELTLRTGMPVSLVKRRTYQEILGMLLSGQVTAAWICGYPFVRLRSRLSLLAVPVYSGQPLYRSYLIAGSDIPGRDLEDFRGGSHAFSDPDSNSGWLVTRHMLAERGLTPGSFFSRTFFTYGHRNVVRAVASGLADTGSVDGYVWDVLSASEPGLTAGTRVIRRSELFGFPPVACLTAARDTAAVTTVQAALLGLAGDAAGRAILGTLRLDGFCQPDPAIFDGIARMVAELPV